MAVIERHPDVEDPIIEMSLSDIAARGGVADIFEEGKLILIKDYRLDVDFKALEGLAKSTESIQDPELRRRLKKVTAPYFFKGKAPVDSGGKLRFADPVRQAVFDVMCNGDIDTLRGAANALRYAHDETLRIFETCFPSYDCYRFIPSVRLTRTLYENLHWDNHGIEADFHQARVFANLDSRPRLWSVSHGFAEIMRRLYVPHRLHRFAGKDPNLLVGYITGNVLGGLKQTWMDTLPRHRIAFDPGEVWLGESRLLSHQINYGEAAIVYMWFVKVKSMADPNKRFNAQVEQVHEEMIPAVRASARAARVAAAERSKVP